MEFTLEKYLLKMSQKVTLDKLPRELVFLKKFNSINFWTNLKI